VTGSISGRRSPLPSIGVGIVAAVVGAVGWAVLVDATNRKIGIVAVGLGLLVGLAMARLASGWRPLPVVAAVVALAGCLLGDVFVDASILGEVTGAGTLSALSDMVTQPEVGKAIFSAGFEPVDVAFWLIAAFAAFRLTNRATAAAAETPAVGEAAPEPAPAPAAQPGQYPG